MIVLVGGEKGGTGKTTIATNLAAMRTAVTGEVLLVDTDAQSTSTYWCSRREDNGIVPRVTSIQKSGKAVKSEVVELNKKYTDIIIDAGGRDSPELRSALLVCDKVIFPLRPSQFDMWTLDRLNMLVNTALEINEPLKAYVLVNQSPTNPASKEVKEMKAFLDEFDQLELLYSVVCERIAFRRAALAGLSVVEHKPEDQKANFEINSLYGEIYA
jgi:chromosome partitioning protein